MKRLGKIVLTALCLSLLAGCGKTGQEPASTQTPAPAVTAAPETAVTPQPEETAAPEEPLVGEALRYQREVVDTNHEDYPFNDHQLVIPKINRDGEGAQALNQKIYDTYAPIYQELQEYQEENRLYNITCTSRMAGDLVGIIMTESVAWQYSEGEVDYTAFYYDAAQDRELTFEEYITALGFDLPTLETKVLAMEDTGETQNHTSLGDAPQLTGCIADEEGTTIIVSHVYSEMIGDYSSVRCYNVGPVL